MAKGLLNRLWSRYKALPLPIKASIWFVICGVFKDAVDVIVTPIFTRMLTTDEYGLFTVYNSWYQIFRTIFTLNLCSDVFTVGLAKFGDKRERYVSSVQGLSTVLFLVVLCIYLIAPQMWSEKLSLSIPITVLMLVQIMFYVPYICWFQRNRYEYRYLLVAIITIVYTILQPVLGIICIRTGLLDFDNGEIRIITAISVQIAIGCIVYIRQFIKKPVFFDTEVWRFSLRMNIPLVPHYLAQAFLLQSAKLIIDAIQGKTAAAIYGVANSAAFVIQVIVLNLNSAFLPWLYRKLNKGDTAGITAYTNILFLLSAMSTLLIVLIAPEVMRLLAPASYLDGIWVIPPLAFSVHLMFVYTQFSNIQLFYEKKMYVLICTLCGAAVNVGLGYVFIKRFGYIAAGYTTMAGYLTMSVLHYIFLRKTCRAQQIPVKELFNQKILFVITLVLAGFCAVCALLYDYVILRYVILTVILCIAIIKRKKLFMLFADFKAVPKAKPTEDKPMEEE